MYSDVYNKPEDKNRNHAFILLKIVIKMKKNVT